MATATKNGSGVITSITDMDNAHSRDSDMILGDNGDIFRLVGIGTTLAPTTGIGSISTPKGSVATYNGYLAFNYDNYTVTNSPLIRIIPRAAELLDYTPGTPSLSDIGAPDEIHGEAGDDSIY